MSREVNVYTKKPVVIEAVQWTGDNTDLIFSFIGDDPNLAVFGGSDGMPLMLRMSTLEGPVCASLQDYIIKGVANEFYPCKASIFDLTYEVFNVPHDARQCVIVRIERI